MTAEKTVYTRLLTQEEVESIVLKLPSLIHDLVGDCIVTAEYGTQCNIHNDLQYKPMEVGGSWLNRFLSESIDQRIFVPTSSDMSIITPDGGLEILFCHEGDIHLAGKDEDLVRRAAQSELFGKLMK